MNIIPELNIKNDKIKTLYHGCCPQDAANFLKYGWRPNSPLYHENGNQGQRKFLYLTNTIENAMWFANYKGCATVVKVSDIPLSFLEVDPEDGISDTVEEELGMELPGNVVLTHPLIASHFSLIDNPI